jgi:regulatory protein
MVITKIKKTKGGLVEVFVDEEKLGAIGERAWAALGLFVGDEADPEDLDEAFGESRFAQAKQRALHLLAARAYTEKQLADRLAEKTDRDSAQRAAGRMRELGLVDDAEYARYRARQLYEDRGFAPRLIRRDLLEKGIAPAVADEALEFADSEEEPRRAEALLRRRYGTICDEKTRRRAAALLERRGYRTGAIAAALRAVTEEENEGAQWD